MVNKNPRVLVVGENQAAEGASSANEAPFAMSAIAIGVAAKLDPFSAREVYTMCTIIMIHDITCHNRARKR